MGQSAAIIGTLVILVIALVYDPIIGVGSVLFVWWVALSFAFYNK